MKQQPHPALTYPCSLCLARPGDSCRKPSGQRRQPHRERRMFAVYSGEWTQLSTRDQSLVLNKLMDMIQAWLVLARRNMRSNNPRRVRINLEKAMIAHAAVKQLGWAYAVADEFGGIKIWLETAEGDE